MPARNTEPKPLPLSDTLHDLAVLRASDIDLATFLPAPSSSRSADQKGGITAEPVPDAKTTNPRDDSGDGSKEAERDQLVEKSYEYVREGRAAIRLLHRGDVDEQGARVDRVRAELEEILHGLDGREGGVA